MMAMPAPVDRSYHEPRSVEEAVALLAEFGDRAGIVAGGTDLVVASRGGRRELPESIVAIHRVPGLDEIVETADGGLRLGALVTHADLKDSALVRRRWAALSDAAALVGSPATRHLGTLGGNLGNGSPAMESGSPLLIHDAIVELRSASGTRSVPTASFLVGPGRTARADDELITAVTLPAPPAGRVGGAYLRLEFRAAMEIAVVGAAVQVALDGEGRCGEVRIALTAVAPTCLRAPVAEEALRGRLPTAEALADAATLAAEAARPIDDIRATARYRTAMVQVIVRRAFEVALRRAGDAST